MTVSLPRTSKLQATELVETQSSQLAPQKPQVEICWSRCVRWGRWWRFWGGRGLWPQLYRTSRERTGVAKAQRLYKMSVHCTAMWTWNHVTVIAEVIKTMSWRKNRLKTGVALKQKLTFLIVNINSLMYM